MRGRRKGGKAPFPARKQPRDGGGCAPGACSPGAYNQAPPPRGPGTATSVRHHPRPGEPRSAHQQRPVPALRLPPYWWKVCGKAKRPGRFLHPARASKRYRPWRQFQSMTDESARKLCYMLSTPREGARMYTATMQYRFKDEAFDQACEIWKTEILEHANHTRGSSGCSSSRRGRRPWPSGRGRTTSTPAHSWKPARSRRLMAKLQPLVAGPAGAGDLGPEVLRVELNPGVRHAWQALPGKPFLAGLSC